MHYILACSFRLTDNTYINECHKKKQNRIVSNPDYKVSPTFVSVSETQVYSIIELT